MGRLRSIGPGLQAVGPRLARIGDNLPTRDRRRLAAAPWRAWYSTAAWQRLRLQVLDRDGWICRQTGVMLVKGRDAPDAAVCDHIEWHQGDPALFWDPDNCQAVAKAWHDADKQRQERRRLYGIA